MDKETKAAFLGVNKRLDKLETRQERTEAQLSRAAGLINTLVEAHAGLTEEVQHLTREVRHLGERMDGFAEQVMRGFTKRDEDHAALGVRLAALEHDRR
ncbi:MAG: hypothetical protein HYZ27_06730 [Deltaproteobacteria bacterium]|nr:hypothetical protein [Deltaproteobacteria bacterium]